MTVTSRADEFKDEGMYVFDRSKKIMMCRFCDCRVSWERKSVVQLHCSSANHLKEKEKAKAAQSSKRQASLSGSFEQAKKIKIDKEVFIKSTVHAFVKANIPLHKLDHPEMRDWLKKYMPGKMAVLPSNPCSFLMRALKYLSHFPFLRRLYAQTMSTPITSKYVLCMDCC